MREVGKRRTVVKDVFITEMTAISSIGDSLDDMLPPLYKGETAVDTIDRFSTEKLEFHKGACISWLDSNDYDNRISELTKRLMAQIKSPPVGTYLLWTGIKGDVEFIEGRAEGKDRTDLYLASHYRKLVAKTLGIEDMGMEINAACASSTAALALGTAADGSTDVRMTIVCDRVVRWPVGT